MHTFNYFGGLKFVFNIICIGALIYQTNELYNEYSLGKTVISLEVKRLEGEPIPAVTICTQNWLSIEKLSKYSHNNEEWIQSNITLYKKLYNLYRKNLIKHGNNNNNNDDENMKKIVNILNEVYRNITSLVEISGLTPFQMMNKYSIGLNGNGTGVSYSYDGTLKGSRITDMVIPNDEDPIESFISIPSNFHKCFTFYSHLKNVWRNIKFKLNYVSIRLVFVNDTWPGWRMNLGDLLISIHSPNSLPQLESMVKIDSHNFHEFTYSQVNTELLGEGYDTDCFNYNLDNNFSMRSDCISSCIGDAFEKQPDFLRYKIECGTTYYPLRYEFFRLNKTLNLCPSNPKLSFILPWLINTYTPNYEYTCTQKCRMDCNFNYYILDHKEIVNKYLDKTGYFYKNEITIKHGSLPDISIKYLPQTTLLSFVCNFGGLLGMWLGLSILAICEDSSKILFKIIRKRNYIWHRIHHIFNLVKIKLSFNIRNSINSVNIIQNTIILKDMQRVQ